MQEFDTARQRILARGVHCKNFPLCLTEAIAELLALRAQQTPSTPTESSVIDVDTNYTVIRS
jgi:hypothetical protein